MVKKQARLSPKVISLAVASCFTAGTAIANPTGPTVVAGQVSIHQAGNLLQITNSPNAILNWQSFSISAGEITRFIQQSAASAVLNRVTGANNPSVILGSLQSNGRVFLVNPSGVLFGAGAQVDVAGLVATSLNLSNADFLAGRMRFTETAGAGAVTNAGNINAASGGEVYLIGSSTTNSGIITAPNGEVVLVAGQSVELVNPGTPNLRVEITADANEARNLGQIIAASGRIGIYAGLITQSGTIRADSAVAEGGRILLKASKNTTLTSDSTTTANGTSGGSVTVQSGDTTLVSGTIEAKGSEGTGGTIQILGNLVGLIDGAFIDASGEAGGGTVLVGGDFQGTNPEVQNAFRTYVGEQTTIIADAGTSGDGGRVIVWSDDTTRFYGNISARGGTQSGDGGFVEVSGKEHLAFDGLVDASAPNGNAGTLLLDPRNILIQNGGTADLRTAGDNTPSDNIFAFFEPGSTGGNVDSTIDATAITGITNLGTAVTLQANNDITVNEAIITNNAAGVGGNLTMQAGRSVILQASITTDDGNLLISANDVGAQPANRDLGAGGITMAAGTTLNAGAGMVTLMVGIGANGADTTSGNILVENITAANVNLQQLGRTNGSSILRASPSSMITATNLLMEVDSLGKASGGSIGTLASPMRVTVTNLEAHTHEASPGIFIDSPNKGLTIGGVPFFAGGVRGVQNVTSGDIAITANGDISLLGGTAVCGAGGGTGGPVCTSSGNITLIAAGFGSISLGAVITAPGDIQLIAGSNVSQTSSGIITADGLRVEGASVSLSSQFNGATNMVNRLAGLAFDGDFRFENGKSLTIGDVGGASGITAGNGCCGNVMEIRVTSGDLLVSRDTKLVGGNFDGTGTADLFLFANAGSITVTNGAVVSATGTGDSGDANVSLNATAGITVTGSSKIEATGGAGGSDLGGSATVTLTSDSGGITVSNASVTATGGAAFGGGSGSVRMLGATGVTLKGATVTAVGGDGGVVGGDAFVTLCGGADLQGFCSPTAGVTLGAGSAVDAKAGNGNEGSGGSAIVALTGNDIVVETGATITGTGGNGGTRNVGSIVQASGGFAEVTVNAKGSITMGGDMTVTGGKGGDATATGGSSGAAFAVGGSGQLLLSATDGSVTVGGNITVAGGSGGTAVVTGGLDGSANASGGFASVFLEAGSGIVVGSSVGAIGGQAGGAGAKSISLNGGSANVLLNTDGPITVTGKLAATGGAGETGGFASVGLLFDSCGRGCNSPAGDASISGELHATGGNALVNSGGSASVLILADNITSNGGVIAAVGGTGVSFGGSATVDLQSLGAITLTNATVESYAGSFAFAQLLLTAGGDISITGGELAAETGIVGGNAITRILSTAGNITLSGADVYASAESFAETKLDAFGPLTTANGGTIAATATAGTANVLMFGNGIFLGNGALAATSNIMLDSTGAITQVNGGTLTAPTATLQAVSGIGTIANLIETKVGALNLSSAGGDIAIANTGDLVISGITLSGTGTGSCTGGTTNTCAIVGASGKISLGTAISIGNVSEPGDLLLTGDAGVLVNQNLTVAGSLEINSLSGSVDIRSTSGAVTVDGGEFVLLIGGTGVNIGSASSPAATIVTTFGTLAVSSGGDFTVLGGSASGALTLVSASSGMGIITTGSVIVTGGTDASAQVQGFNGLVISTGGNIVVTGGSGEGGFARITGNPDVTMIVGGIVSVTPGTAGATAIIEASMPLTIHLDFPTRTSGGFFVNNVEGVTSDVAGTSGFFADGDPAIVQIVGEATVPNANMFVTYMPPFTPPPPAEVINQPPPEAPETTSDDSPGKPEDEKKKGLPVCSR